METVFIKKMEKTLKVGYYNKKLKDTFSELHNFYLDFIAKKLKYTIIKTTKDPDIIFFDKPFSGVLSFPQTKIFNYSAENVYIKKCISLYNILLYFSHKIHSKKFITSMTKIIPYPILTFPLFPLKFASYRKMMETKGIYSISSNTVKQWKGISFPFFLQTHLDRISVLENKKLLTNTKPKKFCAFIVSNYNDKDRIQFFKKLSEYKQVDSYGRVYNNASIPKELLKKYDESSAGNLNPELYKSYKFVICFENSYAEEYITEKLPNAMLGGAIPIYRGAPNVGDYFNTESFINYDDYASFDKMIEKIIELDQDDNKYLEFINRPWFTKKNLQKIKSKEKELTNFFRNILDTHNFR